MLRHQQNSTSVVLSCVVLSPSFTKGQSLFRRVLVFLFVTFVCQTTSVVSFIFGFVNAAAAVDATAAVFVRGILSAYKKPALVS